MVASKGSYQAAIDRARALGGAKLVTWRSMDGLLYRTDCTGGCEPFHMTEEGHTVRVAPDGTLRCNCPAGKRGLPCLHAAAVYLKRLGERAATPHQARVEGQGTASIARPLPGATGAPPSPLSSVYGTRRPLPPENGDEASALDLIAGPSR